MRRWTFRAGSAGWGQRSYPWRTGSAGPQPERGARRSPDHLDGEMTTTLPHFGGRADLRSAPDAATHRGGEWWSRLAAELGDAIFVTEPRVDITEAYAEAGGDGPRYAEVPLSWATDEAEAARSAREAFRFGLTGWKVQSELPNPVNFEAATAFITEDDMRGVFGVGPEASAHLAVAQQFVDAGYDHLVLINAGPDPEGFFDFFASELAEPLRKLTPSS